MPNTTIDSVIQFMEEQNFDFLPVLLSIQIKKQYPESTAKLSYVFCCEESELDSFDINGDIEEQMKEIESLDTNIEVGDSYDHFSEFTQEIAPAYTFGDLKRIKNEK